MQQIKSQLEFNSCINEIIVYIPQDLFLCLARYKLAADTISDVYKKVFNKDGPEWDRIGESLYAFSIPMVEGKSSEEVVQMFCDAIMAEIAEQEAEHG